MQSLPKLPIYMIRVKLALNVHDKQKYAIKIMKTEQMQTP